MCGYTGMHTWPRLRSLNGDALRNASAFKVIREIFLALLSSAFLMSTRDVVLVYLIISSISVQIGLVVLLWQQLSYIYEGQTYLSSLSSGASDGAKESDCRNILRFFGCPNAFSRYLWILRISRKRHNRWIHRLYTFDWTLLYLDYNCLGDAPFDIWSICLLLSTALKITEPVSFLFFFHLFSHKYTTIFCRCFLLSLSILYTKLGLIVDVIGICSLLSTRNWRTVNWVACRGIRLEQPKLDSDGGSGDNIIWC